MDIEACSSRNSKYKFKPEKEHDMSPFKLEIMAFFSSLPNKLKKYQTCFVM